MQGRIAKIRKTKILKTSALINFVLALFFLLFSFLYFKRYDLWFFIFSLFIGIYLLSRGALFKSDSSVYFGSLTFLIGVTGLLIKVFDLVYADIYYLLITALSSIIMVFGFKQVFHLILASIFVICAVITFIFQAKVINLSIFLILITSLFFIFLFLCVIIFKKLKRRS